MIVKVYRNKKLITELENVDNIATNFRDVVLIEGITCYTYKRNGLFTFEVIIQQSKTKTNVITVDDFVNNIGKYEKDFPGE